MVTAIWVLVQINPWLSELSKVQFAQQQAQSQGIEVTVLTGPRLPLRVAGDVASLLAGAGVCWRRPFLWLQGPLLHTASAPFYAVFSSLSLSERLNQSSWFSAKGQTHFYVCSCYFSCRFQQRPWCHHWPEKESDRWRAGPGPPRGENRADIRGKMLSQIQKKDRADKHETPRFTRSGEKRWGYPDPGSVCWNRHFSLLMEIVSLFIWSEVC